MQPHNNDFDVLHNLYFDTYESQLANLLFCDKMNHSVAIALLDEKLVCLAMYNLTYHNICLNLTHGLYVENLYVSPMFHHQDIGTTLLRHVAFVTTNSIVSRLECGVSKDNPMFRVCTKK